MTALRAEYMLLQRRGVIELPTGIRLAIDDIERDEFLHFVDAHGMELISRERMRLAERLASQPFRSIISEVTR